MNNNQNLKEFIDSQRQEGFSDQEIWNILIEAGHKKEDIAQYFPDEEINEEFKPSKIENYSEGKSQQSGKGYISFAYSQLWNDIPFVFKALIFISLILSFIILIYLLLALFFESINEGYTALVALIFSYLIFDSFIRIGLTNTSLKIKRERVEISFGCFFQRINLFFRMLGGVLLQRLIIIFFSVLPGVLVLLSLRLIRGYEAQGLQAVSNLSWLLLTIPIIALYLTAKLLFFDFFIVDKGYGPIKALKRSFRATKGKGVIWFLIAISLALIPIRLIAWAFEYTVSGFGYETAATVGSMVFLGIVLIFIVLAEVHFYEERILKEE